MENLYAQYCRYRQHNVHTKGAFEMHKYIKIGPLPNTENNFKICQNKKIVLYENPVPIFVEAYT